jgi:hypothetical protein
MKNKISYFFHRKKRKMIAQIFLFRDFALGWFFKPFCPLVGDGLRVCRFKIPMACVQFPHSLPAAAIF